MNGFVLCGRIPLSIYVQIHVKTLKNVPESIFRDKKLKK